MADSSVKKVDSEYSPHGKLGQKYLASGKSVSMRLWELKSGDEKEQNVAREYETVGYALDGEAELEMENQKVILKAGDSWVVPRGAKHTYHVKERFKAVEATSPPAHVHGRDE